MGELSELLHQVFSKIHKISKPQRDFISELFTVVFSLKGRGNFLNMSRFSKYNECSFRRQFSKYFDWVHFNSVLINLFSCKTDQFIAAIDCSFIPKSGKKTYGLDMFWSGVLNMSLKGLEVSALALINTATKSAWNLDICQTPAHLKQGDGQTQQYSRIDFYIEQIQDCLPFLTKVKYIVADGFYAKKKIFDSVVQINKYLITKLRSDANLQFLFEGKRRKGQGRPRKYNGKVRYDDLKKWLFQGVDQKQNHLHIYYQRLNSVRFKRDLLVVLILDTKTNKYILLASTNLDQSPFQVIEYYRLRFQIEFLFRDAKQFTCLTHCQSRNEQKLDYHFNMSMTAVNIGKAMIMRKKEPFSLNNIVREFYNMRFFDFIILKVSPKAEFDINKRIIDQISKYGAMKAS